MEDGGGGSQLGLFLTVCGFFLPGNLVQTVMDQTAGIETKEG